MTRGTEQMREAKGSPFGSVHIRWKQDVAKRLALSARSVAYADASVYAGPVWRDATLDTNARAINLTLDRTGRDGLRLGPLNTSAAFPQLGWDGTSPFEVCSAPHGRAPQLLCTGHGALMRGGDLRVANVTLKEAVSWCEGEAQCVGFTAKASGCDDTDAVRHVYFKQASEGQNADAAWVTYLKRTPCAYDSHADGWVAAPATLHGDTIVLSRIDPSEAVAVRSHWRIYPCEHLGCGLYAKAEGLPPPPLYALLA